MHVDGAAVNARKRFYQFPASRAAVVQIIRVINGGFVFLSHPYNYVAIDSGNLADAFLNACQDGDRTIRPRCERGGDIQEIVYHLHHSYVRRSTSSLSRSSRNQR